MSNCLPDSILTLCSERRTTTGDVTMVVRITTTHSSNSPSNPTASLPRASLLRLQQALPPPPVAQLTHMPSMVATRIIWRCGMHRLLNSSSKEVHLLARRVPRLHLARDPAHDAETAARCRCSMLACMTTAWTALRGMIIPDFLDFFSTLLDMRTTIPL